jgi:hypothetical protein
MTGDGEKLHSARRRRFWLILGALSVVGILGGAIGIIILESEEGRVISAPLLAAAAAGVILVTALFLYGSWRFFADVDELELLDNLWGSLVGFYAYGATFPAWWALNKLGYLPEPNDWVIFNIALLTALVAYFYRKWRLR